MEPALCIEVLLECPLGNALGSEREFKLRRVLKPSGRQGMSLTTSALRGFPINHNHNAMALPNHTCCAPPDDRGDMEPSCTGDDF